MENKSKYTVQTVGHSNHPINFFIELIQHFNIDCIVDVRSIPASSYNPQYNKEPLQNVLKRNNITYLHFGSEFGARHTEKELLDTFGKVDFEKVRNTSMFLHGVERLKKGIEKGFNVALMCSESDPFECHRFSMISYYLARNDFDVKHILKDKSVIANVDLEKKLLKKYEKQIPTTSLFSATTNYEQLNLAYKLRSKEVAYDTLNV